jgi:uncharacterized DUF497 family protein
VRFEWDEAKNIANQRKHGVSFEVAATVFEDLLQLIIKDRVDETGEQRWKAVGMADEAILLLVVHTMREDDSAQEVTRIISARRATRKERRAYESEDDYLYL